MSPPAVLPDEADAGLVRMCDMLSCPRTSDNLVTLASCMEAYGGSSQAALEDPLETWRGWKDFLEVDAPTSLSALGCVIELDVICIVIGCGPLLGSERYSLRMSVLIIIMTGCCL